jgi:hypothetical protein
LDFLKDKKNQAIVIVLAILAIGGAAFSAVHFLGAQTTQIPAPPPGGNRP